MNNLRTRIGVRRGDKMMIEEIEELVAVRKEKERHKIKHDELVWILEKKKCKLDGKESV